jgi:hypothetical protein
MQKFIINIMPPSLKQMLIKNRILISFLFVIRSIFKFDSLDRVVIRLLLKNDELEKALSIITGHKCELDFCKLLVAKDPQTVKSVISDHNEEVDYCRLLEQIERFEALGENANDIRLDFKAEKYQQVLKANKDLISRFPDDYQLHDRMARNLVAGGYRQKAMWHLSQSMKLQRKQKLEEGKTGFIFLAGMHRGGTGYTSRSLKEGLGIKDLNGFYLSIYDGLYPKNAIIQWPDSLSHSSFKPMPDGLISSHAGATEENLKALELITDRIVIQVRDPRQALVSKVQYSEYLRFSGNFSALLDYPYPDGFFQWSIDEKIDWQIDNYYFPADIEWIKGWLEADADQAFPCKIHFSLFEVLVKNPKKFFSEILSFYDLPEDKFIYPQKPEFKSNTHLRKGSTDEWMDVLSKEQVQKTNEAIPEAWFERFNWSKI